MTSLGRLYFLASCLLAALVASVAEGAIVEHVVAPKTTDPAISVALSNHYAVVNTDRAPAGDLFVFMPGTGGTPAQSRLILHEAAAQGFRAVGLMYPADSALFSLCPQTNTDPECWGKIRREILTGEDTSTLVTVSPADSIENRLLKLLIYLNATYPDEGWGNWIVSGEVDWSRLRLSGWSQGGGHAAYIAKDRNVAGVICFSSPQDFDLRLGQPAAWVLEPHATPASRYFGFIHENDATALWSLVQVIWSTIGLGAFGPPVSVDTAEPPYAGSHQLLTSLPLPSAGCSYHRMTAIDSCTPKDFYGNPTYLPVWRDFAFWGATPTLSTWLLPSSAHISGIGAYWTTDLLMSNTGTTDADVTVKFLGNNQSGAGGATKTYSILAGKTQILSDVLLSEFGVSSGWGGLQVVSTSPNLAVVSQTSTPAASPSLGSYGQSVPAFPSGWLIGVAPKSISGLREQDIASPRARFRTNLVITNAVESEIVVEATLYDESAQILGAAKTYTVPALGTIQVSRVIRDFVASGDVTFARLTLSTSTAGGAFAAYASVIDEDTADPRAFLPQ